MTTEKARKTGFTCRNRGYSTFVEYEYRGRKYEVEYSNCFNYYCTPAWVQHRNSQAEIDREIEEESRPKKPYRYEDTAQYGFDLFWDYVENGGQ